MEETRPNLLVKELGDLVFKWDNRVRYRRRRRRQWLAASAFSKGGLVGLFPYYYYSKNILGQVVDRELTTLDKLIGERGSLI